MAFLKSMTISLFVLTWVAPAGAFTGYKSSEATVSFEHEVELPYGVHSRADAKKAIEYQLTYMSGALTIAPLKGAPKTDNEPAKILSIDQRADGIWVAKYSYSGTFVLQEKPASDLKMALPNNPYSLFYIAEHNKKGELNPCTDEHYTELGDFWYFWSAFRPGCRAILKEGRDYSFVRNIRVKRIANMKESYPEYQNLADNKGRVQITLIMGKDEASRIRSPLNRQARVQDANAKNFRLINKALEKMGFEGREWSNDEVKEIVKVPMIPFPYVKEFTRQYDDNGRAVEVAVQMVFTDSAIDSDSNGFHYFLEYALEKSAVTIYDGHSGLGGHLDLQSIREAVGRKFNFNLNKQRYQIYFFNSCSSYSYYNDKFFAKKIIPGSSDKKGSNYLDILATGLETAFDGGEQANLALVRAIDKWAETGERTSYQDLAKEMELDNLFGVNGDEDNTDKVR